MLKNEESVSYEGKGISDLVREGVLGTFGMVEGQEGTDVKYVLTSRKILFKKREAQLFLIREATDMEKVHRRIIEEKYRGVLLSTITHDIRTPLTIIRGSIESLEDHVNVNGMEYLNTLKASVNNLEYLMYDATVWETKNIPPR